MLKRLRIAVLLYILLFVAVGEFLSRQRSTDWDNPLWVDVYLVNGNGTASVQAYLDRLDADAFAFVERFYESQASAHGVELARPFRLRIADQLEKPLPQLPSEVGALSSVLWSLKMRWLAARLHWSSDRPTPDATLFAVYHDAETGVTLDRSTALQKGMIAVAKLFADRSARGSNGMIVAHELLHTLGATDKYEPATALPLFPAGFAEPGRKPLYPQSKAELMAGRIPLRADRAAIPSSLAEVVIGPQTAREIGWTADPPAAR